MAQRDGSGDDGLMQRMQLMVYPDQSPFKHVDRWPDADAKDQAYSVFQRFDDMPDSGEEISSLHFSPKAQLLFDEWYCDLMQRCRSSDDSEHMEAHLSKYASLMPSLALIIHVADVGNVGDVSLQAAQQAAAWCGYLESHARRVYGLIDDPLYGARSLASNLNKLGNPFIASDFKNKDWSGLKTGEDRKKALNILIDTGHLHGEKVVEGSRNITRYFINPNALEESDV